MECTTSSVPLAKKVCGDGNWFSFSSFFFHRNLSSQTKFYFQIYVLTDDQWIVRNKLQLPVENIPFVNAV